MKLSKKICQSWPNCNCYFYLALWRKNLQDEDEMWDRNDLEIAAEMIFITLHCVERRCPDKTLRDFAKGQLAKEFWDKQRAKFNGATLNLGVRRWQDNILQFVKPT
jgi:hypothetical protein